MIFETSISINNEDFDIRAEFNYYRGFKSRDRSEPDEPRGWILDESTVEISDDFGWHSVSDANFDYVCTYLEENMDEPFPGEREEDY